MDNPSLISNTVFISWVAYDERSMLLAKNLGIRIFFFHFGPRRKNLFVPIRYLVLAWRTWVQLLRLRPKIIIVQLPPIPSAVVVYLYCVLYHASFILDTHSGSIKKPWNSLFWVHRLLSRKAITTIVPNGDIEKIFRDIGAAVIRIGYTPEDYQIKTAKRLEKSFNVAVPCSFSDDEPVEEMIKAAAELPEIGFYITGKLASVSKTLLNKAPGNCTFTDYLSHEDYIDLLAAADVIMDLTTEDHTVLMGAFEAVSLRKPLITSDWPVLREYFDSGTVYVDNTAEGIVRGIQLVRSSYTQFVQGIVRLRENLSNDWNTQIMSLKTQLFR